MVATLLVVGTVATQTSVAEPKKKAGKAKVKKAPGKRKRKAPRAMKAVDEVLSFSVMARELTLTDAQRTKLQELWAKRDKLLSDWDASAPGQKLVALQGELALAAPTERSSLLSRIRPLTAQRSFVDRGIMGQIMGVLTPEQKLKWKAFLLRREVDKVLAGKGVALTSEQEQKMRRGCEKLAKTLPNVPSSADMARVKAMLGNAMFSEVLTDAQRKKINPNYRGNKKESGNKKKNNNKNNNKKNRNKNNNRNRKNNNSKARNDAMNKALGGKVPKAAKPQKTKR